MKIIFVHTLDAAPRDRYHRAIRRGAGRPAKMEKNTIFMKGGKRLWM